jgi:hypothetical protein
MRCLTDFVPHYLDFWVNTMILREDREDTLFDVLRSALSRLKVSQFFISPGMVDLTKFALAIIKSSTGTCMAHGRYRKACAGVNSIFRAGPQTDSILHMRNTVGTCPYSIMIASMDIRPISGCK